MPGARPALGVPLPATPGGLGRVPKRVHLPARRPQPVAPGPHRLDLPRAVVGVDDRVGEHPARGRVAIDDLAAGRDLGAGQDVLVLLPRQRREQGDRRLAATEDQCRPLGGRDADRVDAPGPPVGVGHLEEPGECGGPGAVEPGRVHEMGLHVDHDRPPRHRRSRRRRWRRRPRPRPGACRSRRRRPRRWPAARPPCPAGPPRRSAVRGRPGAPARRSVAEAGQRLPVGGPPGQGPVLVRRQPPQQGRHRRVQAHRGSATGPAVSRKPG
jgi:hypothetical protein